MHETRQSARDNGVLLVFMWAGLLSLALVSQALGLDRSRALAQFHHTGWTQKEGAPGEVWSIAQTADGWLWFGGTNGLFRFDGVRFQRFEPRAGQALPSIGISQLFASNSGELWMGLINGGVSVLENGRLTHYTEKDGVPPGVVQAFEVDHDGTVWVGTPSGLARLEGTRWRKIGEDWNYPTSAAWSLLVDAQGTLWVASGASILRLRKGARVFEEAGLQSDSEAIVMPAHDGSVWIRDSQGLRPVSAALNGPRRGASSVLRRSDSTLFDRDGSIWSANCVSALCRLSDPAILGKRPLLVREVATDRFAEADGLTSDAVMTMLEDREGNIWVGTRRGVDRFRHSNAVPVEFQPHIVNIALAPDDDDVGVRIGSNQLLLEPDSLWRVNREIVKVDHFSARISCIYRDPHGVSWLGGRDGLWRMEGDRYIAVPLPEKDSRADVHAITQDRSGRLWVAVVRAGAFRLENSVWVYNGNLRELPKLVPTRAVTDSEGRMWFGYRDNQLALIDGEAVRLFSATDGLSIGTVTAIDAGAPTLIGGENGLAVLLQDRFHALHVSEDHLLGGLTGIHRTNDGTLWLNGHGGILQISRGELERALKDPTHRMQYRLFDAEDGLPGTAQQLRPLPTVVESRDGRLWFALSDGVVWIDPARIWSNTIAPPVQILSLTADEERLLPSAGLTLRERTRNVQIDYTALSLSIPERVQFRYRLEGMDERWQVAGGRRQAFYTNLRPGDYRFHVIAANDAGVWNKTGATLAFSIPPTFTQTGWFVLLCVMAGAASLGIGYRLRMRQITSRLRGRLEERLTERERIARELHDTLLQGIHGLILRFQSVTDRIPPHEPARALMEKALDRADEVLVEGRDRVRDLRAATDTDIDLSQSLADFGEQLTQDHRAQFRVLVEGTPRPLHPIVREETYRISREALFNAFLHAQARQIEVEITHGRREMRLRVRDNGCGIESSVLDAGGKPEHWGLPGMRERAQKIRAQLQIWSRMGAGTEIDLKIPAAMAYVTHRKSALRRIFRFGRSKQRAIVDP